MLPKIPNEMKENDDPEVLIEHLLEFGSSLTDAQFNQRYAEAVKKHGSDVWDFLESDKNPQLHPASPILDELQEEVDHQFGPFPDSEEEDDVSHAKRLLDTMRRSMEKFMDIVRVTRETRSRKRQKDDEINQRLIELNESHTRGEYDKMVEQARQLERDSEDMREMNEVISRGREIDELFRAFLKEMPDFPGDSQE